MTPADATGGVPGGILEHDEATTARIDAAIGYMLRYLAPVEFRLARTPAEREAAYRLRYRAVIERGWQPPVELRDELECEAVDEDAAHLIGWRDGHAIANSRITCPTLGQPLPIELLLGTEVHPVGAVVQIDRLCVDRVHSDRRGELLLGMVCATWQLVHRWGFRYISGFFSPSMIRLFRGFGLEAIPLSPARFYWGEERYPVIIAPLEVGERFFERIYAAR